MSSPDALRFLLTLSGKFPARRPPIDILNKIREAFSRIAGRDPGAALSLLLDPNLGKQTHAPIVTAGIGDGLAKLSDSSEVLKLASSIRPEDELRLLAYSRPWATTVLQATERATPNLWTDVLANALQFPDGDLRAKSRRNVVPLLSIPAHAPLLVATLREIDNKVLFSVVDQIRDSTQFAVAEFDEPLRRAARGTEGMIGLRRAILASEPSPASDRFLLATIRPNANDVDWLIREKGIAARRRLTLLNVVISRTSEQDLQSLVQDELLSEKIESILAEDLPTTASQLARVLISGNVPVERLLRHGCRVLPLIEGGARSDLALRMLTLGLSNAGSSENIALRELLSASIGFLDTHRLIAMAIPWNAPSQRVSDNVSLLNHADVNIRTGVLADIEELSARLIARRHETISKELVSDWAHMLADAGSVNKHAQTNAAGNVLSFALEERNKPVGPLIVVAFPIVYAELRVGNEAPGLFSFFFVDWDRCKTARKNIVQAFLKSNWPPTDLIQAVEPTGDLGKVFKRLTRERDGESFLERLRQDISKLPARDRKRFETIISNAMGEREPEGEDQAE
ncbi:hypothetical protein [Acidicapsa ligni]|uniref:hypothetical protein n=1 Tax=Acidicapsa ligni TaxID=542300 RepID=UPI0021DF9744|nr:hypothetical protein [Acidicapsa ligni]